MNTTFPSPDKLIQKELDTLNFLWRNVLVCSTMPQLSAAANKAWTQNHESPKLLKKNRKQSLKFSFNSYYDYLHDNIKLQIHVNVFIEIQNGIFENVSYHLIIKQVNKNPSCDACDILRNFHFDFNPKADSSLKNKSPFFHLQYGGNLPDSSDSNTIELPKLSLPRIACNPLSLALLMQIVFFNFENENIAKIREDTAWKNIVRDNEQLCWKEYYNRCSGHLNSSNQNDLLCDHLCRKSR